MTDAKERAKERAELAWQRLAANVLRMTAGAGKPHELMDDIERMHEALNACYAAGIYNVPDCYSDVPIDRPSYGEPWFEEKMCKRKMAIGAARLMASNLLSQRTQASSAEDMMLDGASGWIGAMRR